jgi:putative ABC transport system permease protein
MDMFLKDVRYGARMLIRNIGTSAISVIALALGIGLTAMMFSIIWGAILRGLPFDRPEQLLNIARTDLAESVDRMGVSVHDYTEWQAQQRSFVDLAAFYTGTLNISGIDRPERLDGAFITPNAFRMLGAQPMLGRGFTDDDDRVGADNVILLSHDTWRTRFGGDASVIGRVIRANGRPTTIIGVMPDGFAFPNNEQAWTPLRPNPSAVPRNEGTWLSVFGRLREGVTMEQAAADMAAIAGRLEAAFPETNEGIGTTVQPYVRAFLGKEPIALLFTMQGAVFMVLLIACANVANLLISRAAARSREVGIRTAMGASGIRIVRQFLTESFILSAAGALAGLGIAWIGIALFNRAIADTDPPFWIDIRLDGTVLMFVLAVTALASLLAGAIPAWQAARANVADVLKDQSRGASSFRLGRISRALVVTEIALSAGLLVGAGLMIKSVTQIRTVVFPFETEVFTARVGLPEAQYGDAEAQRRFFDDLLPRLRQMPGIEDAGLMGSLPALGAAVERFAVDGATYADDRDYPRTRTVLASPGAFNALGVAPTEGRDFGDQDRSGALPVAIVNASFARRFFEGRSAVGGRVRIGDSSSNAEWRTIVGVVPDMYVGGLDDDDEVGEALYMPLAQSSARFMSIVVRPRSGDPMLMAQPVRDAVAGADADLPIYFVETLRSAIDADNWFFMVFGTLFMVFGGVALFLASVGLYGVMSTSVRQRTREMGVRMALGAKVGDVRGLVMKQGLIQLAIGLVLGLALALGVSNLLQMLLFEVNPRDPGIYLAIGVVLSATAAAACLVPAIRATRVDPMHALRYD